MKVILTGNSTQQMFCVSPDIQAKANLMPITAVSIVSDWGWVHVFHFRTNLFKSYFARLVEVNKRPKKEKENITDFVSDCSADLIVNSENTFHEY